MTLFCKVRNADNDNNEGCVLHHAISVCVCCFPNILSLIGEKLGVDAIQYGQKKNKKTNDNNNRRNRMIDHSEKGTTEVIS